MPGKPQRVFCAAGIALATSFLLACSSMPWRAPRPVTSTPPDSSNPRATGSATSVAVTPAPAMSVPAAVAAAPKPAFVAPAPIRFEDSIVRAGRVLLTDARSLLSDEPREVVIDPLIDANTGAQTVSTVKMGTQLQGLVKSLNTRWSVTPLTRQALAQKPLLLIGTLTPVNIEQSNDKVPDAFRVWLTLIDLRTGKVVAKSLDRATVESVNPEPLPFFRDSPTWHKDKTVSGYINSCQVNTRPGDPADPDYLARLPAAAVVNEAVIAYGDGNLPLANRLYREAAPLAEPGDLRVLNGLYLTSWNLGRRDEARAAFSGLVNSGLEQKRLPMKLLFQVGRTEFVQSGDLPQQYRMWIDSLAKEAGDAGACMSIVGHTSRTGAVQLNERLSRARAHEVERLLADTNRALAARLKSDGVGSREALVGLGTDDFRDALDRRVEFRVVDCT
jgi:outer membrane protein OmpA-like peptidoglycan-associated protein